MLFQFQEYLTFENIYIYSSFGVLPFWLLLIAIPNSRITQIFVNSIILPIILSTAYIYVLYKSILLGEPFIDIFKIYLINSSEKRALNYFICYPDVLNI